MRLLLLSTLAMVLSGCGKTAAPRAAGSAMQVESGPGIVVSVPRHLAIWMTIRATEMDRIQGWKDGSLPGLWVYSTRDLQPVILPASVKAAIVWLDGETVVAVDADARGGETPQIPPREVTQALVVPYGTDLHGLTVGDQVRIIGGSK